MITTRSFIWECVAFACCCVVGPALSNGAEPWDGEIVQYGKMHEAIGKKQHQGRVHVAELTQRDHLYAVAAMEKLEGEITVLDGEVFVTSVDGNRKLQTNTAAAAAETEATMLVGAYVPEWKEIAVAHKVTPEELEAFIEKAAAKEGIDTDKPFPFVIEGELTDVRFHVINGACPMHARLTKVELPSELSPVEVERADMRGIVVGMFAKDAVGNLTHPATSTHAHLIAGSDPSDYITGHLERVGIAEGAILRLPIASK